MKTFKEYRQLREAKENKEEKGSSGVGTKISLGDGNDYEPLIVSDDTKSEHYGKNKDLAPIIRAFKNGANWGWSKDDKTGQDKPVKITSKKLYLCGGSVRDHLAKKKSRNNELASNASPDEVYRILTQNDFKYLNKNQETKNKKTFRVKEEDSKGRPTSFYINVNDTEFELDLFSKTPRGIEGDRESGSQLEDSLGRDFTINGMYLLLSNDNGPNKEISDFHGGIHDFKMGKINSIGDLTNKITEDPKRILRFIRMLSGYGDPDRVSDQDKKVFMDKGPDLMSKLDRSTIMDEFKKGMKKDDANGREYLNLFKDFGLLGSLFPKMTIDDDLPSELEEIGDSHMPIAWMLRMNDPNELGSLGFDNSDMKKISFLINSLGLDPDISGDKLSGITNGFLSSGITGKKLKDWGTKVGGIDGDVIDAFLNYQKSPRVKVYFVGDDGEEQMDDMFADLIDPFTGEKDNDGIEDRKKHMELDSFKKHMHFMRPE